MSAYIVPVVQCEICGQIIGGADPENLQKVCLPCCPNKRGYDTGYRVIMIDSHIPSYRCRIHCPTDKRIICNQRGIDTE